MITPINYGYLEYKLQKIKQIIDENENKKCHNYYYFIIIIIILLLLLLLLLLFVYSYIYIYIYMFSKSQQAQIFTNIYLGRNKQLYRKFNSCKRTCKLPIQCTFNIEPIFYEIKGNYSLSSNNKYNTILTFTEDATIILYIPLLVHFEVYSKSEPSTILVEGTTLQKPGEYPVLAGSNDLIIKLSFNISC